jgi:ABC-type uncharacterized transport system ATPase subunit
MDDIARLASRLLLMSAGTIVYDGSVQEFTRKAKALQKVKLKLSSPAADPIYFRDELKLDRGSDTFVGDLTQDDVGPFLQNILKNHQLSEIAIEQTDFEDVVHGFLATESGLRQPRHSPAT